MDFASCDEFLLNASNFCCRYPWIIVIAKLDIRTCVLVRFSVSRASECAYYRIETQMTLYGESKQLQCLTTFIQP